MIEIFDDNNNLIFLKLKNYWIIYLYNEDNQIKYWRNSYNHSEIYMNQMKEYRHRTYTGHYGRLEPHEVFVFGSNMDGYHGSGNAGYACHGAMKLYEPYTVIDFANTPDNWKGAYAIKGYNEGMMRGHYGWGYAIPTVLHAGDRQSIPKEQLIKNIQRFYDECRENQDMEFILAYGAEPHLRCGYTLEEFVKLFVDADRDIPKNIVFNDNFYQILLKIMFDKELIEEKIEGTYEITKSMNKYRNANPLEKLHDGEPYFFIRAQDINAPEAVNAYAELLYNRGDIKGSEECKNFAKRMKDWQTDNFFKVKNPD